MKKKRDSLKVSTAAKGEDEIYADSMRAMAKFEVGTPVTFNSNGREVSGEVVIRNQKKYVSLYKDSNYSGSSERVVTLKIGVKSIHF